MLFPTPPFRDDVFLAIGAPLAWEQRLKVMGSKQTRRHFSFDTERTWTFTIYQNLVHRAANLRFNKSPSVTLTP